MIFKLICMWMISVNCRQKDFLDIYCSQLWQVQNLGENSNLHFVRAL